MNRIFWLAETPLDVSLFAAVAIGEPNVDQRHVGIVLGNAEAEPSFLHLATHCVLRNDAWPPRFDAAWVACAAHRERLRQLAAFCRRIWRKHSSGGIPYAFSDPGGAFDSETGEVLLGPSRFGLTCASFVLAVFHAAGLQLVDYSSWPIDRPGDREWQEGILKTLSSRADAQHLEHVRSEIGSVRYRPEEVAAAATSAPPPVGFAFAEPLGRAIVAKLRQDAEA